jgi:hypothetical protein
MVTVKTPLNNKKRRTEFTRQSSSRRIFIVIFVGVVLVTISLVYCYYFLWTSITQSTAKTTTESNPQRPTEKSGVRRKTAVSQVQPNDKADIAAAMNYLKTFKSLGNTRHHLQQRPLKFFHIPKSAGTAVEDAAGLHKLAWGSCLFRHKPKRDICPYPKQSKDWPGHSGWWHLPQWFFPIRTHDSLIDPYQNAESFAVVREPYDRMISEFYYICTLRIFDWRPDQCQRESLNDKEYMNDWLQQKLKAPAPDQPAGIVNWDYYMSDNGHFTPQYDFIVGPNEVRYVDHVLRLEDMTDGFTELMAAYGLDDLHLKKMNALGAKTRDDAQLTTRHLSPETLELLHERFDKDFMFGYPRRSVDVAKEEANDAEKDAGTADAETTEKAKKLTKDAKDDEEGSEEDDQAASGDNEAETDDQAADSPEVNLEKKTER